MPIKKIAIIRTDSRPIDLNSYNCQEIGLAKGLSKLGYDIDVIMAGNSQKIVLLENKELTDGKVQSITIPYTTNKLFDSARYPTIKNIILSRKYDFIHVNEVNELITFQISKIAFDYKIELIVYQGMYKDLLGRKNKLKLLFYKYICYPQIRQVAKSIAAKTSRAQIYLQSKGFTNITIFPVGLDQTKFNNAAHFKLKETLKIPENHKILTYIGVFEKRRNLNFLIELAESLKTENYSFILAGNGEDFEKTKQLSHDKKLTNVYFLGKIPQNKVPSIYSQSDLFLLASDYEIYGMVILESLYFGCPVFSTKTAGAEDLISSHVNGYLFNDLNIDTWKNNILQHIESFDRNTIKKNIKDNFIWDELAKQYKNKFLDN